MRKLRKWLSEFFDPATDTNLYSLGEALGNPETRRRWILDVVEEIKRMNIEVDRRLISGTEVGFIDLCARRKAFQDVLEMILVAKRTTLAQDSRPNPKVEVEPIVNLDRVTA